MLRLKPSLGDNCTGTFGFLVFIRIGSLVLCAFWGGFEGVLGSMHADSTL